MAGLRAGFIRALCLTGLVLSGLAPGGAGRAAERWDDLADTVFQHYTADSGLPHQIVTSLAQDGDGFLWIGTEGGLARWDGYRYRTYKPDPTDRNAVPDNWITALHADRRGRLWVGTNAGGLARYDRDQDCFVVYGGLSKGRIGAIIDDDAEGLWIAADGGLDHLDPASGATSTLHHDAQDPVSLPDGAVQAVLLDRLGTLWVGTRTGLARRGAHETGFTPVLPRDRAALSVTTLFQDDGGLIWIGTHGQGAYSIDQPWLTPRPLVETDALDAAPHRETIFGIGAAGPSEVWLASYGGGIIVVDSWTMRTKRIRHNPIVPSSLIHDNSYAVLRDRAGSIWVGTIEGLDRRANDNPGILTLFGAADRKGGPTGPDIISILPTGDDQVWLGYGSGGIDIVDPRSPRVTRLSPDPARPQTMLPKSVVYAIAPAGGHIFIGTGQGLYRAERGGGGIAHVNAAEHEIGGLITTLLPHRGSLWVGSRGDGVLRLGLDNPARPDLDVFDAGQLTDPRVNVIERGVANDLWIGTLTGLNRLDLATRAVERIMADPHDPDALPSAVVTTLLIDRHDRLWVGTLGGGIAIMTGRDAQGRRQFRRLDKAGLPSGNIDRLLQDAQGMVWASTNDGIAEIDPDSLAIRALRRADGIPTAHFVVGSGAATPEGELLFGGVDALTVIRPDRLKNWDYHPAVAVTDVRVGGKPVPANRFNGAGSTAPLVIRPEVNSLTIEFAALDFTAPERNRYAYRLDGFDTDWVETDASRRLAAYTNLPPGSYTLRLRGSNRDGIWTDPALAVPILVLPAWYQTLWFHLLLGAAGIGAMTLLVQTRTGYLRRREAELERQIAERTADLERRTLDLRGANERLLVLATTDQLTGCANRHHFFDRAAAEAAEARRHNLPLSLMILDLDHFKRVNDTYGHPGGDQALRAAANACRAYLRARDVLARLGGEEFGLLMPGTDAPAAAALANRLREALAGTDIAVAGTRLRITASIGVAMLRPDESVDSVYARADTALYAAKAGGRNRVVLAEEPSDRAGR